MKMRLEELQIYQNPHLQSQPSTRKGHSKPKAHDPHFKTHNAAAISLSCLTVAESDRILLPTQ